MINGKIVRALDVGYRYALSVQNELPDLYV